jgi:hypothetical protein
LEFVWHPCSCCSPRKDIVWHRIFHSLGIDLNWTASCSTCGCYSKTSTYHSYGQFAHTQVKSHHSKNCINTSHNRSSSGLFTRSYSIRLHSFEYIKQKIVGQ